MTPESDAADRALTSPAFYRPAPASVDVIDTPCSRIYLAGDTALKTKKPVDLGYLDFRSLAARRAACHAEVELNAPLAPGVYLGVMALIADSAAPLGVRAIPEATALATAQPEGAAAMPRVLNYAVRMRRLPADGMLSQILASRELSEREIEALASALVRFHYRAPSPPDAASAGATAVEREVLGNASQVRDAAHALAPPSLLAHVSGWLEREVAARAKSIDHRVQRGRVRDGHGDLHAGNVCFDPAAASAANPTGLIIYDRLEFRRDFRLRDTAAEVASLCASIESFGRWRSAQRFTSQYILKANDGALLLLHRLWCTHYALVRAKIEFLTCRALRGRAQAPPPDPDGAPYRPSPPASMTAPPPALERARHLLRLAVGYTLPPVLVLSCGLPGSGKSFLAGRLAAATGACWLRADEVRKELAGLAPTDRGGETLYTPGMTQRVYESLRERARTALDERPVIIDATARTPPDRAALLSAAGAAGVPAVILHCHASEEEALRRLRARAARNDDASDADAHVYEMLKASWVDPGPAEGRVVRIDDHLSPGDALDRVLEALIASS